MLAFCLCLLVTGFATNAIYMDVLCGFLGLCSAGAIPPAIGILGAVYKTPSKRKNKVLIHPKTSPYFERARSDM